MIFSGVFVYNIVLFCFAVISTWMFQFDFLRANRTWMGLQSMKKNILRLKRIQSNGYAQSIVICLQRPQILRHFTSTLLIGRLLSLRRWLWHSIGCGVMCCGLWLAGVITSVLIGWIHTLYMIAGVHLDYYCYVIKIINIHLGFMVRLNHLYLYNTTCNMFILYIEHCVYGCVVSFETNIRYLTCVSGLSWLNLLRC